MKKSDFDSGKPSSCWLKEMVTGEIDAYLYDMPNKGLVKKYNAKVDETTSAYLMETVTKLDDYPEDIRKIAVDLIREELDANFEK